MFAVQSLENCLQDLEKVEGKINLKQAPGIKKRMGHGKMKSKRDLHSHQKRPKDQSEAGAWYQEKDGPCENEKQKRPT